MITSNIIAKGILRALATLVLIAVGLYFLFQIQSIIIYLVVALVLTLLGNPIQRFLKKRLKFNNIASTIVTLFLFILIIVGFIMLFVPLILSQGQSLSLLNITEIQKNINQLIAQLTVYLEHYNIDADGLLKQFNVTSKISFDFIPIFLNSIISTVSSLGIGLASVLFITFFFLKDKIKFVDAIKYILPDQHEEKILNSLDKINNLLTRYFVGILIQLSIVFILYLIVLLIFGIENPIVIAFICAVLNIVPYVGPLIASLLAAILTMISNLGHDFQTETIPLTIYVLIGFWIVQIIDNNLCQPYIFSNSVKCHPLEIFLVILIVGFLFGVIGMIIAVPVYTMIKVIGKEFLPENKIIQLLTKNI